MRLVSRANATANKSPVRKNGHRGREIERGEPREIRPGYLQRHRNMQHDLEHDQHDHGICHAQARAQRASVGGREAGLPEIGEDAASAQSEQRDRNRQKCEVVKKHNGEKSGQRQFQQ